MRSARSRTRKKGRQHIISSHAMIVRRSDGRMSSSWSNRGVKRLTTSSSGLPEGVFIHSYVYKHARRLQAPFTASQKENFQKSSRCAWLRGPVLIECHSGLERRCFHLNALIKDEECACALNFRCLCLPQWVVKRGSRQARCLLPCSARKVANLVVW